MIYTVTFNPSLDVIVMVKHFQTGEINRTADEKILPGGKGINVSIVLNHLGVENKALGFLAGFTGEEIERLLDKDGIRHDFIHLPDGNTRINMKIRSFSDRDDHDHPERIVEEETAVNGQGPFIDNVRIREFYDKLNTLKDGDVLVLSGSIPASMPETIYQDICMHLQGKGIRTVVDATGSLLTNVLPFHPFLIKPNQEELGDIFHVTLKTREEIPPYAKKLQEMGAANVFVSMGGEGAVLLSESGDVYASPAPKGTMVNTVGAGDSSVAGFLAGFLQTGSYSEAFLEGICAGSASAFSEGLAGKEDVSRLMNQSRDTIYRIPQCS